MMPGKFTPPFLKTPQDDTLDLCILLRLAGTQFIVTGDVVQGGSGEVLSELGPLVSSEQEEETEPFGQHICRSILEQEDTLVQALRQGTSPPPQAREKVVELPGDRSAPAAQYPDEGAFVWWKRRGSPMGGTLDAGVPRSWRCWRAG